MDAGGTVNEHARIFVFEGLQGKVNAALEQFRRLGLKIVVHGIPQDFDPMRFGERGIIELNLHINNVRDAGAGHNGHVVRRPNASAQRNSSRHPRDVHPDVSVSHPGRAGLPNEELLGRQKFRLPL